MDAGSIMICMNQNDSSYVVVLMIIICEILNDSALALFVGHELVVQEFY